MRPDIRVIQDQQVEITSADVDGWEAEQLLRKYGYNPDQFTRTQPDVEEPQKPRGLTFEEMIQQEESRLREEENKRRQRMYGPKPKTFDGSNGYDSEIKYGSDDDSGYGFRIEITTDMKLPKY